MKIYSNLLSFRLVPAKKIVSWIILKKITYISATTYAASFFGLNFFLTACILIQVNGILDFVG